MAAIDYKEKYEQALERASKLHDNINASSSRKAWLEDIFPELAESEDERIRKSIIELLNEVHFTFKYYDINKMLAWLEKHKYTEDDLDKAYKCADEVQYRRGYEDAKKEIEKQADQKPKVDPYSLPTSDDSDLPTFDESIYHPCIEKAHEQKSSDEEMKTLLRTEYEKGRADAIEEMQNLTWSEKDESVLDALIRKLEGEDIYVSPHLAAECLKSLKGRVQPQSQWKPSKEQMEAIKDAIEFLGCSRKVREDLKSLYEQMKKLREE